MRNLPCRSALLRLLTRAVLALALLSIPNLAVAANHELVAPDSLEWRPLPFICVVGGIPAGATPVSTNTPSFMATPTKPALSSSVSSSHLTRSCRSIGTSLTSTSPCSRGAWCVGQTDKIDPATCKDVPTGSYLFIPCHMRHWAVTKNSIVELDGVGPC